MRLPCARGGNADSLMCVIFLLPWVVRSVLGRMDLLNGCARKSEQIGDRITLSKLLRKLSNYGWRLQTEIVLLQYLGTSQLSK